MRDWFKGEGAELAGLARRPAAGMAVLGFLLAQMSLQADLYVPVWVARTVLADAVFWLGQAMILGGAVWFVIPEMKRFVAPPRVSRDPAHDDRAPIAPAAAD